MQTSNWKQNSKHFWNSSMKCTFSTNNLILKPQDPQELKALLMYDSPPYFSDTYRILALDLPFISPIFQVNTHDWKGKIGSYFTQHLFSLLSTPVSTSCRFWNLMRQFSHCWQTRCQDAHGLAPCAFSSTPDILQEIISTEHITTPDIEVLTLINF